MVREHCMVLQDDDRQQENSTSFCTTQQAKRTLQSPKGELSLI